MQNRPGFWGGLIIALRPWSFTTTLAPQIVTLAVLRCMLRVPLLGYGRTVALLLSLLAVQATANLINSWKDFEQGIDTKAMSGGDRTLVDNHVSLRTLKVLVGISLYCWCSFFLWSVVASGFDSTVLGLASLGTLMAVGYTAGPAPLKHLALGDLAVFVCFGPAVVAYSCLILVGVVSWEAIAFTTPVALYVTAVLHANNNRDIHADTRCGVKTVASLLGPSHSRIYYDFLLGGAHIVALAAGYHYKCVGSLASLLVFPQSLWLCTRIRNVTLSDTQPEETAKSTMMMGVALSVGITLMPGYEISAFSCCLICLGLVVVVVNSFKVFAD